MSTRTRTIVLLAAAASGLAISVVALLRMLLPGFLEALPPSLSGRLGSGVELAVSLTGGLAVLALAGVGLAAQRGSSASLWPVRAAGLVAAALAAVTIPGGMIPAAGYTFAMAVIIGIVVFVVLVAIRRPWVGIPLAALIIGVLVFAGVKLEATRLPALMGRGYVEILPEASLASAHLIAAAGLLACAISDRRSTRGALARFVVRRRVPITMLAAACALPYAIARASWLTPWPLFGGDADMFADEPVMRATGLMLGLGVLMGGLLTLGLILPWGERFPRFLAGVGGRAVPAALAIIPASAVSVLFTAGGAEFALMGTGDPAETIIVMLVLPFWLWGPLLGFAAWGYAMHRADVSVEDSLGGQGSPSSAGSLVG